MSWPFWAASCALLSLAGPPAAAAQPTDSTCLTDTCLTHPATAPTQITFANKTWTRTTLSCQDRIIQISITRTDQVDHPLLPGVEALAEAADQPSPPAPRPDPPEPDPPLVAFDELAAHHVATGWECHPQLVTQDQTSGRTSCHRGGQTRWLSWTLQVDELNRHDYTTTIEQRVAQRDRYCFGEPPIDE